MKVERFGEKEFSGFRFPKDGYRKEKDTRKTVLRMLSHLVSIYLKSEFNYVNKIHTLSFSKRIHQEIFLR